jgi:hypothetical protein
VLRAIRAGKISAGKDEQDERRIEAVKLHLVYPPLQTHEAHSEQAHQDALIAELRTALADMRRGRDEWREQAHRLALLAPKAEPVQPKPEPAQIEQPSRIVSRLAMDAGDRVPCGRGLVARLIDRARGCSTAAAAQQPPPGCFTVEMSHSRA